MESSSVATGGDSLLDEDRAGRRRRRRRLAAATALVAAAVVLAAIVLLGSHSSPHQSAGTAVPAGQTTTAVTRRTLTESATVEGTLGYGATLELYNRLSGTFTWLPAVGATIGRGETLYRIDERPVALMYGPVPAYRTLKEGVSDGPDVAELNRNLIDLGFDPYGEITVDRYFGAATAAAVRRWQEAERLPATGEVELGRVIFAPGARRVTAVHVSLGQDPPAGSKSNEPATEEPAGKSPSEDEASAKEGSPSKSEPEEASDEGTPGKGSSEEEKESPEKESPGSGGAAAEPVLGTTSTKQLVQIKVGAGEQSLARLDESAPVTLPNGSVVKGRITKVGTVAEAAASGGGEEGGGEATISVTLALEHPVARLDKAPVSVELVKSVRRDVLAVPATALMASAGGGYAVEALRGAHRVELAVRPGMFADGYVQVEGPGIHAGLKVTEPAE